ncbi:MAG: lyase family protein, partial [Candidatus Thorarchaeota archaeon]
MGTRKIPRDAYWGVQTLRARENFGVSLVMLNNYSTLIETLAMVKKACTLANRDLGHLSKKYADAIIEACNNVIGGVLDGEFIVDMMQGG